MEIQWSVTSLWCYGEKDKYIYLSIFECIDLICRCVHPMKHETYDKKSNDYDKDNRQMSYHDYLHVATALSRKHHPWGRKFHLFFFSTQNLKINEMNEALEHLCTARYSVFTPIADCWIVVDWRARIDLNSVLRWIFENDQFTCNTMCAELRRWIK